MVLIESVLDTFVENLSKEITSKAMKIVLSLIFLIFFILIVSAIIEFGIRAFPNGVFFGILFILFGILIFVFFTTKFLIIYNKKLNKKLSKFKIFKIEKRK